MVNCCMTVKKLVYSKNLLIWYVIFIYIDMICFYFMDTDKKVKIFEVGQAKIPILTVDKKCL